MRELSKMHPKDYRDKYGLGSMQEGALKIKVSRILDDCDEAKTVEELRAVLSRFITQITGVK
jgi:hypothetical protein